jgi:FkbM family methyltransferase
MVDKMREQDAEQFVRAAYNCLLMRPVDPAGLELWRNRLSSEPATANDFLRFLLESPEFATVARRFFNEYLPPKTFLHDNSQNGETQILLREMIGHSVQHRVAVDVGAYGRGGSNTYDLLRHFGWRGVLVEPNPNRHRNIRSEFADCDYTLVELAATDKAGTATLHFGVHDEITSIHRNSTEHWGPVHSTCEVATERLPVILEENDVPKEFGLLSVDAEGEGINLIDDALVSGYRPSWMIVEVYKGLEVESLAAAGLSERVCRNYSIVGRTFANLILLRED